MIQQLQKREHVRLRRHEIFLHVGKTCKLIVALMRDRRIPAYRKVLFVASIVGLVVLLFFPDLLGEAVLSTVLPVVGTILGIPLDVGMDWAAFALVAVNLLRIFPADLLAEHYTMLFKS